MLYDGALDPFWVKEGPSAGLLENSDKACRQLAAGGCAVCFLAARFSSLLVFSRASELSGQCGRAAVSMEGDRAKRKGRGREAGAGAAPWGSGFFQA